MKTKILQAILLMLWAAPAAFGQDESVFAQRETVDRGARSTGSQYAPSTLRDTGLGSESFRDYFDSADSYFRRSDAWLRFNLLRDPSTLDLDDGSGIDADKDDGDRDGDNVDNRHEITRVQPVRNLLLDWVPAQANRLHNGGFGLGEDNGRPVPYRLNGHVGIQRAYPWEPGN